MLNTLKIKPIPTQKDDIVQPKLALNGTIPRLTTSSIFVGKSGSGKSNLVANLLLNKHFYGDSFKHIFLISPTGLGDDIQKALKIPDACVVTDIKNDAEPFLQRIYDHQTQQIEKHGVSKVPMILCIFDDIIGDTHFMNSSIFTACFIRCRHANMTTFLCSQHFKAVPKKCRLQAACLFFFALSNNETDLVCEEFSPPGVHKKTFKSIVERVIRKPYDFLMINMKEPWSRRFRHNLDQIIDIDSYKING